MDTEDTSRPARSAAVWLWISTAARFGLALVWLVAGATKVGDLAASGRAVNAYRLMPYEAAKVVGAAQPFLEIALGLLLLVGLAVRLSAGISAVLLVVFIAGIVSAWARGLAIDCGCFSSGGDLAEGVDPGYLWEILRDLGFLALAGILLWRPRTRFSLDALLMGD
ncbi:MauE/DoxX family redox-associated membrane protein [Krasilnikovia sp. M28-CT-15]|uniref:MauE/DoxX family redox-associated membrane protein n=1 Tax=Krasilnikovia sp. M28-CT-15 TaxID=3373540 RepID=UPI0038766037